MKCISFHYLSGILLRTVTNDWEFTKDVPTNRRLLLRHYCLDRHSRHGTSTRTGRRSDDDEEYA
jgi:hypothetical protein